MTQALTFCQHLGHRGKEGRNGAHQGVDRRPVALRGAVAGGWSGLAAGLLLRPLGAPVRPARLPKDEVQDDRAEDAEADRQQDHRQAPRPSAEGTDLHVSDPHGRRSTRPRGEQTGRLPSWGPRQRRDGGPALRVVEQGREPPLSRFGALRADHPPHRRPPVPGRLLLEEHPRTLVRTKPALVISLQPRPSPLLVRIDAGARRRPPFERGPPRRVMLGLPDPFL